MYFQIERQQNILQIDEDYATLKKMHDDGTLEFEFRYSIKQKDAIRVSTKVEVSVFSRPIEKKPIVSTNQIGNVDSKKLISNILSDATAAKTAVENKNDYVIQTKNSDVSAFINNSAVKELRQGKPAKDISSLRTNKLKSIPAGQLKESNDIKPVLQNLTLRADNQYLRVSSSIEDDTQRLSHDLIFKRGLDPSSVTSTMPTVISSQESIQGTITPTTRHEVETGALNRLRDNITLTAGVLKKQEKTAAEVEDTKLVEVLVSSVKDTIDVPVIVRFIPPKKKIGSGESSNVFVNFNLLDPKTNLAIDTVTKQLKILQHIKIYRTPVLSPIVNQVKSEISSKVNLEIAQSDSVANEVHIYKKNLYTSLVDIDNYELVGVYPVQGKQRALVQVQKPLYNAAIYRCISAFDGVLSNAYSSAVIKPKKYKQINALSLTAKFEDKGILLEARKLPPGAVSIQFMRRNLSLYENEFTNVKTPKLIDSSTRSADYLSAVVSDVVDNNIYEFAVKIFYRDGLQEIVNSEIIEYVLPAPGKVDIKLNNINIRQFGERNVAFDVNLNVVDKNLDEVKTVLERQGIQTYFDSDISKQRDQLNDMFAYSVHRVNMSTGEREDFGVITGNNFSDEQIRGKLASKPLKSGSSYRYTVTAVSRSPETTFDSFEKTVTDPSTKKTYTFKPSKFLHPVTLKRGVITSAAGLKTKYAKNVFEHGTLGANTTFDVTFDRVAANVIDANASSFDRKRNVISWRIEGSVSEIDHFVISKETHGLRKILGTAHNQFPDNNCQWIHDLTPSDRGQISYVITPIMDDYKRGNDVQTNMLLVGDI
jgi:hypothetical protein